MGQGPDGSAVAVDDDRLAFKHAVNYGISTLNRQTGAVICVRRAHNGEWEFAFPILRDQQFFAGNLVT